MSGRPKLAEGFMRCQARCSGCDKPSPGRGRGAILAQCQPSAWAVILRCRAESQNLANWCTKFRNPPLHGSAMLSPLCTRGAFLWPSAWAVILSLPFFIQPAFSDAPGQDCTLAPTGVGLPAPEHPGQQRIPTGDRNGCGATPPCMSSLFSGNTVCNKKREEQECREKWRSAASTHPNCRL